MVNQQRDNQGKFVSGMLPWNKGLKGVLKPNKTSFQKGRILPQHIEDKRLRNSRKKTIIQPNFNYERRPCLCARYSSWRWLCV